MKWTDIEDEAWAWTAQNLVQYLIIEAKQEDVMRVSVSSKFIPALELHMREWMIEHATN